MPKRLDKSLRAATARLIRWDGFRFGVAVDHGDGKHRAYSVGAQEAAEAEAQRIRSGASRARRMT